MIYMEEEVIKIIDDLRPFLMNDGGNIEFVKLEDNIVYISIYDSDNDKYYNSIVEATCIGRIENKELIKVIEI